MLTRMRKTGPVELRQSYSQKFSGPSSPLCGSPAERSHLHSNGPAAITTEQLGLFSLYVSLLNGKKSIHRKLALVFLKVPLTQRSQRGKTIQTRYLDFHDSCHISNRGRHCKLPL